MPTESEAWRPERPRLRLFPFVVSWLAAGLAFMVAAGLLPGVYIDGFLGALLVAAVVAVLNAVIPPVLAALRLPAHTRARLPARVARRRRHPARHRRPDRRHAACRRLRLGAARVARGRGGERRARRPARLGRHVVDPDRAADRAPAGHHREHRRPRDRLPRDRRARAAGAAAGDARRQRADDGPLAGRAHAPADRVGDRPLVADGRQPGGDPARIERGHPGVPLGGEGDRDDDDVLGAAGLRGDRAPARDRHRPARRRRRQPRQPALRRGGGRDPHRQPDGRGEAVQSRLPRVPRQRRQRHAHARPLHLGGHPRVDGRGPRRSGATSARAGTVAASTR